MEIKIFGKVISFTNLPKDVEKPAVVQPLIEPFRQIVEEKKCRNKVVYNANTRSIRVITCNGDVFSGADIDGSLIDLLKDADDYTIIKLLSPKAEVVKSEPESQIEKREQEIVSNYLDIFNGIEDFEVVDKQVFLKGIKSISIPPAVVAAFIDTLTNKDEERYNSLLMFTYKLLTSPRQESIEQVLNFCRHNDIRLSKRGNLIAYRRVVKLNESTMPNNPELVRFVKESVEKVKKAKKGIRNYQVYSSDDFTGFKIIEANQISQDKFQERNHTVIGNLYELYNNVDNMVDTVQMYTSWHSPGKYTFAIGDIYNSEDGDIDVNAGNCHSGGLHFAACSYNYDGYGDTPVVVLINPAKTITIPTSEIAKGRTTEMKLACLNPNERGVHIDYSLIEKADEEYDEFTREELAQAISEKSFKPLSVEEEVCQLTMQEVVNVHDILLKRVVKI